MSPTSYQAAPPRNIDYSGAAVSRQIDLAAESGHQAAQDSHQLLYGVPSIDEVNGELECTSTIPLFV